MCDTRTVTEMLRDAGYGHRRYVRTNATGKHEVYEIRRNKHVGYMDALEAAEFAERVAGRLAK